MNLAKVSANGQVTVPVEIRRRLGLKEGDKILFFTNRNGDIVINNASASALEKVQQAMVGIAAQLDVKNDEDVQRLVDSVRYGRESD